MITAISMMDATSEKPMISCTSSIGKAICAASARHRDNWMRPYTCRWATANIVAAVVATNSSRLNISEKKPPMDGSSTDSGDMTSGICGSTPNGKNSQKRRR